MTTNLATRLSSRLKEWTGRQWFVVANGQGGGRGQEEGAQGRTPDEVAEMQHGDVLVRLS
jgi:DNA polymerase-3 subunit gamma/tau